MKLHRLSMKAIGPFPDEVVIDLARLGSSGLFLLEGPTGAGKSTVLDAISFAFYGKVSTSTSMIDRLRSDHAALGVEPVIELVFETQSGLFRVRRTPPYSRPKQRGTGEIAVTMTAKLFRLSNADDFDGGELLSNRLGEIDDEITRAVGLTHGQFVQTVLLPQGEFARLLRSDTNDKRALLQRLFGNEAIAQTQAALVQQRRDALARSEAAAKAVAGAALSFAGAAGFGQAEHDDFAQLVDAIQHPEAADSITARVATTLNVLGQTSHDLKAQTLALQQVREKLAAQLAAERDRAQRRHRRDALTLQHTQLLAAADDIDESRKVLVGAQRAAVVTASAETLAAAVARVDQTQGELAQSRAQLTDHGIDPRLGVDPPLGVDSRLGLAASSRPGLATADATALSGHAAELRARAGALRDGILRERGMAALHTTLRSVRDSAESLADAVSNGRRQLTELADRQAGISDQIVQAEAIADRVEPITAEVQRAAHRLAVAEKAAEAEKAADLDRQITLEALAAEEAQATLVVSLNARWRAGVAGQLGVALIDGDPCQVCGSPTHPAPAQPPQESITEIDLRSAESEHNKLRMRLEKCRAQLAAQQTEHLTLLVAAESFTPDRARTALEELQSQLIEAERAADSAATLKAENTELRATYDAVSDHVGQLADQLSDVQAKVLVLSTKMQDDETLILASRAGFDTVADHYAAVVHYAEIVEAIVVAQRGAAAAITDAESAGLRFAAALETGGFASETKWRAAHRSRAEVADLSATISNHERQWAAVSAQLQSPELSDPDLNAPGVDVAALDTALGNTDTALTSLLADFGAATDRLTESKRRATQLAAALKRCTAVAAETSGAIRVGNLVSGNGENRFNMELTTYLLVRRFGEILAAANSELRTISRGRYELEHSGAKQGNSRSGLSLRVHDLYTGKSRDPGSLSGGETFYVSLALALGLADVVRAESGGIDLGTLFIDEGFGSLDPEVLEDVIDVLEGLRAGGRTVGIVSHVSELKARIADQIQIRRNPDGSSRLQLVS